MAQGELWFKNVKSALGKDKQFADLMVGTVREGFVQQGGYPKRAEPLRKMG